MASKALLIEISNLKHPLDSKTEEHIIKNFKECTGFMIRWDLGEHASGTTHSVNSAFIALMIAHIFEKHPEVKLLLKLTHKI